ncbi:hypothetical protein EK21DRAFT_96601 [Setomelanomma holmii]|uniref:Heterokaryon incompatibility domain-containing protein n=1 Tax=Setomelanomma holmii TaxID=210430 RepID=A0A9P4LT22_9PLEO|nr:hypothetical protein EK21DRAFT_96601 [Setomelanomma holmii]
MKTRRCPQPSSPTSYKYDELPKDGTFRFLTLLPGVGDAPLECNLHTAKLAGSQFEAISYVWGTKIRDQKILCDGQTVLVTPNLAWVLRRVRLPNKPRTLWADSICIHQDDPEEKGHQVALFGDIYRAAQRVLVCLGPDDKNHGPIACSLMDDVVTILDKTFKRIKMSHDSFRWPNKNDPLLTDQRWKSFRALFECDWFKRSWVVQEVAFARDSRVLWGESTFIWDKVMRTCIWLLCRATILCHGEKFFHTHEGVWDSLGLPSILETLECARNLQLEDQRDRIYAFTKLPQAPRQYTKPWPDYHSSYLDTYRQFAIEYVLARRSTEILDYVCHDDEVLAEIPSWVPLWNVPSCSLGSSLGLRKMSLRTLSIYEPRLTKDGSLRVRGVIFDTVYYASDLCIIASGVACPYAAENDWSTRLQAFLESLSYGQHRGDYSEWKNARESFVMTAQLERIALEDRPQRQTAAETADETNHYYSAIKDYLVSQRFILTERGYMGLAPAVAHKGSLRGIIFGCQTPCVLERTDREQYYKFLGATTLMGKERSMTLGGDETFINTLGVEDSKDWVEWNMKEQDIYLC